VSWTWSYDVAPPEDLPSKEVFSSQSDAESWIGEQWRALAVAGVHQVTLLDDGASVYRMSLDPVT
jgi:hypothetical protein